MPVQDIFSSTINLLGKTIDLRARQQNLISSNIANAETPNYAPKALVFEDELQGALKNERRGVHVLTNPRHIPLKGVGNSIQAVNGRVEDASSKTPGKDGNAVELEGEMSRMMENQIMYNASIQIIGKKFTDLSIAIKEGR